MWEGASGKGGRWGGGGGGGKWEGDKARVLIVIGRMQNMTTVVSCRGARRTGTRFNKIHPRQRPRWQMDKVDIYQCYGMSFSSTIFLK